MALLFAIEFLDFLSIHVAEELFVVTDFLFILPLILL